jgi:DNA-binding MarR family transcriptional regulator
MTPPPTLPDQACRQRFFEQISPQTDPELVHLLGLLRTVSHALYRIGESRLEPVNLSYAQYRVLMALLYSEQMEGQPSLNPSEISRLHGTSRNTISALIRSLEAAGLVERRLDLGDRRKFNICLTARGRDIVEQQTDQLFAAMAQAFTVLDGEERAIFGRLLTKLATTLTPSP